MDIWSKLKLRDEMSSVVKLQSNNVNNNNVENNVSSNFSEFKM